MPYVIGAACIDVTDKSCIEECPVDCIYEGARKLYINPAECIDCGACEPVCPVEAISQDRRVPADEEEFVADNARFFEVALPGRDEPLGSAGGADATGVIGVDTEFVAKWEPAGLRQQESPAGLRQQESPAGLRQQESPAGLRQQESRA